MVIIILFLVLYVLSFLGMYLVKDYRNGILYKGFVGKIQNLIKH